jgi:transposase InsO family protein
MNIHQNARSCAASRALLVHRVRFEHRTVGAAAEAAGISERTAYKWLARYRVLGPEGLCDASSRPHRSPWRTPEVLEKLVVQLRRSRMTGPQISRLLRMPGATVARILKRNGLEKLSRLEPRQPVRRYEKKRPGELIHLDIKKLAKFRKVGHRIHGDRSIRSRGAGWEYVHVCVDDNSRLAYAEVLPNEQATTAISFLRHAVDWLRRQGVKTRAVLTDNGSAYVSYAFAQACKQLGITHRRTRPYRPQTNGKAERFIKTMLAEWAYVAAYASSRERTGVLQRWLRYYNRRRPHGSLKGLPPISRLRTT